MFTSAFLFFLVFGLLFVASMFIVRPEHKFYKYILFVIFLIMVYGFTADIMGSPKPLYDGVPMFNSYPWTHGKIKLMGFYADETRMYLFVNPDDPRLYSMAYDQQFINELKKALQANKGSYDGLEVGFDSDGAGQTDPQNTTAYSGDTKSHVFLKDPQTNTYVPKAHLENMPGTDIDNFQVQ